MSIFSTGLPTNDLLGGTQDNISSTLNGAIAIDASTITLASTSTFPSSGYIQIENETIWYGVKDGNDLKVCTRGQMGTTAAPHANGLTVELTNSAGYIKKLQDEVVALAAKVGIDASAVTTSHDYKLTQKPTLINRQDNTSNSSVLNQRIQTGWGFIQGTDVQSIAETVTLPVAYDTAPIIIIGVLGAKNSSPSAIGDFDTLIGTANMPQAKAITQTQFTVDWVTEAGTIFSSSYYYGYTWIAIGTIA